MHRTRCVCVKYCIFFAQLTRCKDVSRGPVYKRPVSLTYAIDTIVASLALYKMEEGAGQSSRSSAHCKLTLLPVTRPFGAFKILATYVFTHVRFFGTSRRPQ